MKNSKIIWIAKLLNEEMNLKEKLKMAFNFANPKVSLIHKSSKLPFSKSILGPYVPKSTILNPSSPSSILILYIPKFKLSPTYPPKFPPFSITLQGVCQERSFHYLHPLIHKSSNLESINHVFLPTILPP